MNSQSKVHQFHRKQGTQSNESSPELQFNQEQKLRILLAEYDAIERMHVHYDILNMSLMVVVTAGVFTIWGLVIQAAFQSNTSIENPTFVNHISILALALFFVLSVWTRYLTIHRCIIIQKLNRSHEIEKTLNMKQNLIFRYDARNFSAPLDSGAPLRRRPGGHALELLLYLSLAMFGVLIALAFQWHVRLILSPYSYLLIGLLMFSLPLALLWMGFCKLDAAQYIEGTRVGFPWNLLFFVVKPVNKVIRWLLSLWMRPLT